MQCNALRRVCIVMVENKVVESLAEARTTRSRRWTEQARFAAVKGKRIKLCVDRLVHAGREKQLLVYRIISSKISDLPFSRGQLCFVFSVEVVLV